MVPAATSTKVGGQEKCRWRVLLSAVEKLVIYLNAEGEEQKLLLSRLGKHKMGKVCLYFKRLSDLDYSVLEKLVTNSVADVKRRHR
jgi:hypothetical protein